MKLLKLLFLSAILLSACNNDSTDTPETGEPKQIIVEMASNDFTDVSGTYTLENNKEYCTREDGKYKILLVKSTYINKGSRWHWNKEYYFRASHEKGVVSGRVSTKGYGYTAGSVTLGKWGDGSKYGDLKAFVKGIWRVDQYTFRCSKAACLPVLRNAIRGWNNKS